MRLGYQPRGGTQRRRQTRRLIWVKAAQSMPGEDIPMLKHLHIITAALLLAACSKPAEPLSARSFEVRGVVRGAFDPQASTLTIEHENITGYMPSMTMPFPVKHPEQARGLRVGDGIQFKLVVTDMNASVDDIRKIDAATVRLGQQKMGTRMTNAARLKEGDRWPDFTLKDQDGRTVTQADFAGRPVLVTFFFTSCPIPNYCPLMSQNFAAIQKELAKDEADKDAVQFLSISFDPEHDTPQRLAAYAATFTHDTENWRFATGTPDEVARLTSACSVYVQTEGGTISHGLCTALVGPRGVIRKIWRGNSWTTAEVIEAIRDVK
jgi:protein SCO1/2